MHLNDKLRSKSVVIIDDDEDSNLSAQSILSDLGYSVVEYNIIDEYVINEMTKKIPFVIFCAMQEQNLPHLSLLHEFSSAFKVPVILTTPFKENILIESPYKIFEHDVITKPFSSKELQSAIQSAIEKKQLEVSIKESNLLYEVAFKSCPVALLILKDGTIINCNNSLATMLNVDNVLDIIGKRIFDFLSPDLHSVAEARMYEIMAGKALKPIQYKIIKPDGNELWVEANSSLFYYKSQKTILTSLNDITKSKEYLDTVHSNHIRLFSFMNNMRVLMYISDIETFTIKYINDYTFKQFGNILGCKCYEVMMQLDKPCKSCYLNSDNRDKLLSFEHRVIFYLRAIDRWFDCRIFYDRWLDGSLVRVVLGTDITNQKRLAKEVARKKQELKKITLQEIEMRIQMESLLEQTSKLATMGELVGAIAHQWKQPLNSIALIAQSIQDSYATDNASEQTIDDSINLIMQQLQFITNTIDTFRNFFTIKKRQIKFDVCKAIQSLLFMFSAIFKEYYVSVNFSGEIGKYFIYGDENSLKHIILNIINNSKDAIVTARKSGRLTIDTLGIIDISVKQTDSSIIIIISDNARGVPTDIINDIFKPYFTTKTEGSGIGLYICKNLVEQAFNGTIDVFNNELGAVFHIEIPIFNQHNGIINNS